MSTKINYILSLNESVSPKLKNISGAMSLMSESVKSLQSKLKNLQKVTNTCGDSFDKLFNKSKKNKISILDFKGLDSIEEYNKEEDPFLKKSQKSKPLRKTKSVKKGNSLLNSMSLAKNIALKLGESGMSFAENMAKFNVKAQLDEKSLNGVYDRVFEITKKNKGDIDKAPIVLGNLMDKTNDVALSFDVLESAMNGARTGISDIDTISDALAESLINIGKENASAKDVLDTLMATSRVGAGGFQEVANNMPTLISGASKIGVSYKEVGGLFAFMTNMGKSAGQTVSLMEGMFDALGNSDIQKNLQGKGINLLDKDGTIASIDEISKEMSKLFDGKSSEEKSNILSSLGLNDSNAVEVFSMMTSNVDNLSSSLNCVSNSVGETQRAIEFSVNPMQKSIELWNSLKTQTTEIGVKILPLINSTLTILSPLIGGLVGVLGAWSNGITNGSIGAYALLGAVAGLTTAYIINKGIVIAQTMYTNLLTAKIWLCNIAQNTLKITMATTPWGLVALGIGAVAGALMSMDSPVNRLDGAMNKLKNTFADFNVELSGAKTEANDAFDSAMKAKVGSEERAKAIKKINDQYSIYLPCLLTEDITNKELVSSLRSVNIQLENKLKNKYYEQEMDVLYKEQRPAEKKIFEEFQNKVGFISSEAMEDIRKAINNVKKGNITSQQAGESLSSKYGFNNEKVNQWKDSRGFVHNDKSNVNSRFIGSFSKFEKTIFDQKKEKELIEAQYGVVNTTNTTTTNTINNNATNISSSKNSKVNSGASLVSNKDIFNLNSVKNLKGTTTYGAIMEKLAPLSKAQIKAMSKTNVVSKSVEKANSVHKVIVDKVEKKEVNNSDMVRAIPYRNTFDNAKDYNNSDTLNNLFSPTRIAFEDAPEEKKKYLDDKTNGGIATVVPYRNNIENIKELRSNSLINKSSLLEMVTTSAIDKANSVSSSIKSVNNSDTLNNLFSPTRIAFDDSPEVENRYLYGKEIDEKATLVSKQNNTDSIKSVKELNTNTLINKLFPLKMATTTAVASAMLAVPTTDATIMPKVFDNSNYDRESKNISMQKFCDNIEIRIDKADGKGYNQITDEIQQQLSKMIDDYDA